MLRRIIHNKIELLNLTRCFLLFQYYDLINIFQTKIRNKFK